MKAFLLAAGKGTRLKPFTDKHPKCLIPIHGIPLLQIWIDLLEKHGVTDVLINTHHHADQVERFARGIQANTAITLHTIHEPRLRGSAGTIWDNRAFVSDEMDFIIAYADNLTNLDLSKMIDLHRNFRSMGGVLTMGLIRVPDPSACGIVALDDTGRIKQFIEKPSAPASDLGNSGVYIVNKEIFRFLGSVPGIRQEARDLGYHLLPLLVDKMFGYRIEAYLKDIGTPEAYSQALSQWPAE